MDINEKTEKLAQMHEAIIRMIFTDSEIQQLKDDYKDMCCPSQISRGQQRLELDDESCGMWWEPHRIDNWIPRNPGMYAALEVTGKEYVPAYWDGSGFKYRVKPTNRLYPLNVTLWRPLRPTECITSDWTIEKYGDSI